MGDIDKVHIEPLDLENYKVWSQKMMSLLTMKDLWSAVRPAADEVVPAVTNAKALAVLGLHVKEHHMHLVSGAATAAQAWAALESLYMASTLPRQMQLRREMNALEKGAAEPVVKYVGRAKDLRRDLLACGANLEEREVVLSVLNGLPEAYNHLVTVLQVTNQDLTLDTLLPQLLLVEQHVVKSQGQEDTKALLAKPYQERGRRDGDRGKARSWDRGKDTAKSGGKDKDKVKGKCWKCGQEGHHRFSWPGRCCRR